MNTNLSENQIWSGSFGEVKTRFTLPAIEPRFIVRPIFGRVSITTTVCRLPRIRNCFTYDILQENELRRCLGRIGAAFPPTRVSGPNFNSDRQWHRAVLWILEHLVLYRMQQRRHLSLLRPYRLHAPSKMEVLPGGHPEATGGKLSVDNLVSKLAHQARMKGSWRRLPGYGAGRGERNLPPQRWGEPVQSVGGGRHILGWTQKMDKEADGMFSSYVSILRVQ
jgi:hypothetical protein